MQLCPLFSAFQYYLYKYLVRRPDFNPYRALGLARISAMPFPLPAAGWADAGGS